MTTWVVDTPPTTVWAPGTGPATTWTQESAPTTVWGLLPVAFANPSFETAFDPVLDWTPSAPGAYRFAAIVRFATGLASDGAYVARCELQQAGSNYYGHPYLNHVAIATTPGLQYRVRCRIRIGTGLGTPQGSAGLECADGDGNTIGVASVLWSALTTTWQNLDVTFVATRDALTIDAYGNALPGNTKRYPFWMDNITIVTTGPGWNTDAVPTTVWS